MKKSILIIKHIDIEEPGNLEEFFGSRDFDLLIVDVSKQSLWSVDIAGIKAVIVLGGPMNVYEEDLYPFLKDENLLLKLALQKRIPILGICLGAQLLAKACGVEVRRANKKEMGWDDLSFTPAGEEDKLFLQVKEPLKIFQWHEDTFDIPSNAELLVIGRDCRNQAFRVGDNAYGLQFHIEVTPEIIKSWIYKYAPDKKNKVEYKNMVSYALEINELFKKQAYRIYENFESIVKSNINMKAKTR